MKRRRNSLRLNVFDYSQPAAYFVTLCTHDRMRVLGRVVNGRMILSETGKIVENVWKEIPDHFPTVQVEVFQIMPDHVHGIVEIRDLITQNKSNPVGVEYIQPRQRQKTKFQHITPNSLHSIIRSFKAAVTREAHRKVSLRWPGWQRSFYDRVIRDEVEHYFIRQYIELNPLMWEFGRKEPGLSPDELRSRLRKEHGLSGPEVERVMELRTQEIVRPPAETSSRDGFEPR